MSETDQPPEADSGWRSVAENTHNTEHWHYGDESGDEWASITANADGSTAGFYDEKWTVEYYDGTEPIERERVASYPEMLEAVAAFMKQHEERDDA